MHFAIKKFLMILTIAMPFCIAADNQSWYTTIVEHFKKPATLIAGTTAAALLAYLSWHYLTGKPTQKNEPRGKAEKKLTSFDTSLEKHSAPNAAGHTNKISVQLTNRTTLIIEQGDITQSHVEAIVNAANAQLFGGPGMAGVCRAIFDAAGVPELQAECDKNSIIAGTQDVRCATGDAKITSSYALARRGIKYIIHAVGPDCRIIKNEQEQDKLLRSTYEKSLLLADQHNITSIAFPFISSAIYAFPKDRAARIALETIKKYVLDHQESTHLKEIHMILFGNDDYQIFAQALRKL